MLLVPVLEHFLDNLALEIFLRTAEVAGNDWVLPKLRVPGNIFLATVCQWTNDYIPTIVAVQHWWHRFKLAAVEHIQEQGFQKIIAVMAKGNLGNTLLLRKVVENAPP